MVGWRAGDLYGILVCWVLHAAGSVLEPATAHLTIMVLNLPGQVRLVCGVGLQQWLCECCVVTVVWCVCGVTHPIGCVGDSPYRMCG
jgi:hypothetical protein